MNQLGVAAEQAAADYLTRQGLRIVARNWRCRRGEIDLICRDGAVLVFVEVRQRRSSGFASAAESIDGRKQAKLVAAAQLYLVKLGATPACRFDAVLFDGDNPLRWLKHIIEL